jgi:hypothetical protein
MADANLTERQQKWFASVRASLPPARGERLNGIRSDPAT